MEPSIRQAVPADREAVVRMVTAAFREDPAWRFLTAGEYERLAPHFAGSLFDLRVHAGTVWVGAGHATVSMWDPPGGVGGDAADAEDIWRRYAQAAGDEGHARMVSYRRALAAVAPEQPYWYLGVLATDPSRRREGLASSVIGPAIQRAQREGLPCCLETSTEGNRRFYERRGFVQARPVTVPDGPPTWWLTRPATA